MSGVVREVDSGDHVKLVRALPLRKHIVAAELRDHVEAGYLVAVERADEQHMISIGTSRFRFNSIDGPGCTR